MRAVWVSLFVLGLLQVRPVRCPDLDSTPESYSPVPELKDTCGNSTIADHFSRVHELKDTCGNDTITCARSTSSKDMAVPWLTFTLSFIIFIVPVERVIGLKRLKPNEPDAEQTLFWWSLLLGSLSYILWMCYLWACRKPKYSAFPVFLTSIVGAITNVLLLLVATVKISILGDQRGRIGFLLPVAIAIVGAICRNKHIVGWIAVALGVLSHSCRIGSVDYYHKLRWWLCSASVVAAINGFLWLAHPQLCISLEYKIGSYIIGCLRGLEAFLWVSRRIAAVLWRLEGRIIDSKPKSEHSAGSDLRNETDVEMVQNTEGVGATGAPGLR